MVPEGANQTEPAASASAAPAESAAQATETSSEREQDAGSVADRAGVSANAESGPEDKPAPSDQSPAPAPPPPDPKSTPWPDHLLAVMASFYEWLSRPRVRLTLTGVILLVIGGVLMTSSVWTLPLVIVGVLMIVIAWIGGRLDGRFAVEWGESGTQLEFRAKIRAVQPARLALTQPSPSSRELPRTPETSPNNTDTIDGEAHTVEIDVAELESLIAAVETAKDETVPADGSVHTRRSLRVARDGR